MKENGKLDGMYTIFSERSPSGPKLIRWTDNLIQLRRKKIDLTSKKTTPCYQITVTEPYIVENADLSTTISRVGQGLARVRKERDHLKS